MAASDHRLGIDFFNGTGTQDLLTFSVPTNGPVSQLVVADLDGDLINDVAFVEAATSATDRDSLMIAFGNHAGPPATPALVARIGEIEQISAFYQMGLGNLVIAYLDAVPGGKTGVLAFLAGSGDRVPFAPYDLVSVSDGSLLQSAALAVAVGRFTATGRGDVMALGIYGNLAAPNYTFWLLPGLGSSPSTAVRLGGQLDPRLKPFETDQVHLIVNVTAAAADVDGDGRDESLWAMPADENLHCGLLVAGTTTGSAGDLVARDPVVIDEPCPRAQLVPIDADGDGAVDIALLTGSPGNPGRNLLVLWNDGAGGYSSRDITFVSAAGDSPEQFTLIPATKGHPLGFAYVTDQKAVLVTTASTSTSTPRAFGPPRKLVDLQGGSGIVAADVNGDGVLDLALAASGNLSILQAELATP